jgi:Beta-lactamase
VTVRWAEPEGCACQPTFYQSNGRNSRCKRPLSKCLLTCLCLVRLTAMTLRVLPKGVESHVPVTQNWQVALLLKAARSSQTNSLHYQYGSLKRWMNSMTRKTFLFVFAVVALLSNTTWAQVPSKEKVFAGAERAFEKFTQAYVGPAPGCAAAVSLNGETVFEKAFGLADMEHDVQNTPQTIFESGSVAKQFTAQRSYCCNRMESSVSTIQSGSTFQNYQTTVRH